MEKKRLWEVDAFRGTAVLMMVISNLIMDLVIFAGLGIDIGSGFWFYFARATAGLFILIAGMSLTLSYNLSYKSFRKFAFRGTRIFGWGLAITVVTWILFPENVILFGVLHLIGLSIVLSYPFIRRKNLSLISGIIVIIIGFYLSTMVVDYPWLLWLGLNYQNLFSFDYVPLFPWFGVVLVGIFLGNIFFPGGKQRFKIPDLSNNVLGRPLARIGRNSLLVYLVHQPVIVGILYSISMLA
jgi:uncharacterized membrane protein